MARVRRFLTIQRFERNLRARRDPHIDKADIAQAFASLLATDDLSIEDEATLEEALRMWESQSADFADCLMAARAAQLGRTRFATFDVKVAKLPHGMLIPVD